MTARAAQGDIEAGFSLLLVEGDEKRHQIEEFSDKNPTVFRLQDVITDHRVMAVAGTQLFDEMGIGKKTDVQDHVRIGRQSVAVTERGHMDDQPLSR